MVRTIGLWLLPAGMLFLAGQTGFAQIPEKIPAPLSPPSQPLFLTPQELRTPLDIHVTEASYEDHNGPLLIGNSFLDPGGLERLGWFGTLEVGMLDAHVNNGLRDSVTVAGATNQVSLPSARLNWTASPRLELGYRCGQGAGELVATYRFVIASGSETTPAFDPLGNSGNLHSQLNMHVFDLDYASQENSLLPWCDMKWRAGVRISSVYFSSRETSPTLEQHVANSFVGAGPHVALDLWKPLGDSNLGMFCRLDTSGVLGRVQQTFEETVSSGPGSGSGYTPQSQATPSVSFMAQAGLTCTPREYWRITLGYSYEHWWDVGFAGQISQPPTFSRGDLAIQGIFLRSEWKF